MNLCALVEKEKESRSTLCDIVRYRNRNEMCWR